VTWSWPSGISATRTFFSVDARREPLPDDPDLLGLDERRMLYVKSFLPLELGLMDVRVVKTFWLASCPALRVDPPSSGSAAMKAYLHLPLHLLAHGLCSAPTALGLAGRDLLDFGLRVSTMLCHLRALTIVMHAPEICATFA